MSIFRQFHKLWIGCLLGNILLIVILVSMIYLSAKTDSISDDDDQIDDWIGSIHSVAFPIFAFSSHNTVPDIFQVNYHDFFAFN